MVRGYLLRSSTAKRVSCELDRASKQMGKRTVNNDVATLRLAMITSMPAVLIEALQRSVGT